MDIDEKICFGVAGKGAARPRRVSGSRVLVALIVCLVVLPLMVAVYSGAHWNQSLDGVRGFFAGREACRAQAKQDGSSDSTSAPKDKFLGGLLPSSGFDESSCSSRYKTVNYRKSSPYKPSRYLIEKLRRYEDMHKKCGPSTELYKRSIEQLQSNPSSGLLECNYVVWLYTSGLGNRILTITSAFLYALLTNRVLLIEPKSDMRDLFCEPFPHTSWLLPNDFPRPHLDQQRYGNLLRDHKISTNIEQFPPFTYLHLDHDYNIHDKRFFCDEDQKFIQRIPWTLLSSNNYFLPSLFQMPGFEDELNRMFPNKNTVFHHLGRYLFHPTNEVWGLITRYYDSYLAKADTRVGIQVRIFEKDKANKLGEQIFACAIEEKLLPEVNSNRQSPQTNNTKAVLLTSLYLEYYDKIKNMFWEHSASNGEIITVYQPSHEESQQLGNRNHEMKALAEMYLLSMTDELVISAWSTFGYVAQGLGNLKSWILDRPVKDRVPDPPCRQADSIEPCFHAAPHYNCEEKKVDTTMVLAPYLRRCEDVSLGIKLVDRDW